MVVLGPIFGYYYYAFGASCILIGYFKWQRLLFRASSVRMGTYTMIATQTRLDCVHRTGAYDALATLALALVLDGNESGGTSSVLLYHFLATHVSTCEWFTTIHPQIMHSHNARY